MLIDATLKYDLPPVALPTKEHMERAKDLWEELGLPTLTPRTATPSATGTLNGRRWPDAPQMVTT